MMKMKESKAKLEILSTKFPKPLSYSQLMRKRANTRIAEGTSKRITIEKNCRETSTSTSLPRPLRSRESCTIWKSQQKSSKKSMSKSMKKCGRIRSSLTLPKINSAKSSSRTSTALSRSFSKAQKTLRRQSRGRAGPSTFSSRLAKARRARIISKMQSTICLPTFSIIFWDKILQSQETAWM